MSKNILFILHCPPPVHGSSIVGQSIKNSSKINNYFECRYINLLVSRTIDDTGKAGFLKIIRFIGVWTKLLIEIFKKKPDLCYLALTATGAAFYKDVLLIALLRIAHIKRIYHLHNKGVSKHQLNRINRILYSFVFKDADVILLSKTLYQDIKFFVPESRVSICPNGTEDAFPNFKPRFNPNKSSIKIVFLSNLIESKGVFVLLDACSLLQQKNIDFECDFIGAEGDITISQFNKKIIQQQLNSKVHYLGKKYGKEKNEILEKADIFAFPTYYSNECFPLVLLEAMSAGLPVVSTFEGGITDIVQEDVTGFVVPQRDSIALSIQLERLILNPELRYKMSNAARNKFENEFKFDIFQQRMIKILDSLFLTDFNIKM